MNFLYSTQRAQAIYKILFVFRSLKKKKDLISFGMNKIFNFQSIMNLNMIDRMNTEIDLRLSHP